jgi:uncharacterized membrane protein
MKTKKTILTTLAIVAALTLVTAVVATTTTITANSAFAEGGPKAEKNYGQCKQDFNEKPCQNFK